MNEFIDELEVSVEEIMDELALEDQSNGFYFEKEYDYDYEDDYHQVFISELEAETFEDVICHDLSDMRLVLQSLSGYKTDFSKKCDLINSISGLYRSSYNSTVDKNESEFVVILGDTNVLYRVAKTSNKVDLSFILNPTSVNIYEFESFLMLFKNKTLAAKLIGLKQSRISITMRNEDRYLVADIGGVPVLLVKHNRR